MSRVERSVPRVVHADDIKQRRVHLAGRGMHFVCGVTATEDTTTHSFQLSPLPRVSFAMYPEERSGIKFAKYDVGIYRGHLHTNSSKYELCTTRH